MKYPIIICEECDIQFFKSTDDAEAELEPIDVKNGIYLAYDSEGAVLNLVVHKQKIIKKWWQIWLPEEVEKVKIEECINKDFKAIELSEKLSSFYEKLSIKFDHSMSLSELVSLETVTLRDKI
jgi:hypothetical protein